MQMLVRELVGTMWAETDGGVDLGVLVGELDGLGRILESLADGEQMGQAGAAGTVEDGVDVFYQLGERKMAVGVG